MGLFDKLFKKSEKEISAPKGFHSLVVSEVKKTTNDSVYIAFEIPADLKNTYRFIPGQYVNIYIEIEGKQERRSYSICSGPNENLAIAIKKVENGKVSSWAISELQVGDNILVSQPEGNFIWDKEKRFIVAFVAGSGITPVLSIAKHLDHEIGDLRLFYGNKSEEKAMFLNDLNLLKNTKTVCSFSEVTKDGHLIGRLNKDKVSEIIKSDLNLLKADAYYLCGPEALIKDAKEVLELFGVAKNKIHFELFTTPVLLKSDETTVSSTLFEGISEVSVILDQERIELKIDPAKMNVLQSLNDEGYDPPYSCRGGVCCSCKAKVLEGKATMKLNYSLTEEEVNAGYILTCQAYPASEKVVISYDA